MPLDLQNMLSSKIGGLLLAGVVFLCTTTAANAQFLPGMGTAGVEKMLLRIEPSSPAPGQTVTAELTSTVIDLDRSTITWILNGIKLSIPNNSKAISFKAGNTLDSQTSVIVVVRTNDGQSLTRQQEIRAGALDLLWEADSYTPPFYRGKGLPAAGSTITVTAIPNIRGASGKRLTSNDLIFTWTQNGLVVPASSGRGKNTATFAGPEFYKEFDVIVEAVSFDQSVRMLNRLTLEPVAPQILVYENHPTLGIRFENTLFDSTELAGGEITVTAQPFFFASKTAGDNQLRYRWNINGSDIENPSNDQSSIVLRAEGAGGMALVSLGVEHLSKIFQQAQQAFTVSFTGSPSL